MVRGKEAGGVDDGALFEKRYDTSGGIDESYDRFALLLEIYLLVNC